MIHVCYMTNDGYCAPTAVSAVSVFENHRDEDVCVHVLTEFVSHENENLLLQAAEPYPRGTVCLHNCDEYIRQIREEYRPTGWKGTCNAYLYMFMEEIFPDLDRVLWIDGDTIIRRSLRDLWQTDLQGKLLGGVLDVPAFTSAWPMTRFITRHFILTAACCFSIWKNAGAVISMLFYRNGSNSTGLNSAFPIKRC